LEESVRTISALFGHSENGIAPSSTDFGSADEPLESRVASISAEIAAAIAQAQARQYEDEEDDDGEESELETIGPNTSGIRGASDDRSIGGGMTPKDAARIVEEEFEDDDGDAFPVPLRTRKSGKGNGVGAGGKRKR
jgi:hypothetical protein